ncbi:hypothetical protein Q7P36_010147 [Cladosporium allicinum]
MIERAMLLKDALYLYQDDHRSETDAADYLTSEDWYQLADLLELLRPIYDASMRVQSRDTSLYEVLTSMDFILTHLESAKLKPTYTAAPYFKAQYLIAKAASTTTQQQPAMPVVSKDLNLYDAYNRLSSPTEDDEDDL